MKPRGLYIHIPFCKSRCNYCDFISNTLASSSLNNQDYELAMDAYVEALIVCLRRLSKRGLLSQIETVYLGGGTPTYLGHKRLNELIYAIALSVNLHESVEFTVEANPDSLTLPLFKDIFSHGVNRISLGVQSFNDETLRFLGRPHDAKKVTQSLEILNTRPVAISLDLICGISEANRASTFKSSLKKALEFNINHLSIYPLMIEEESVFGKSLKKGLIADPHNDELAATEMDYAHDYLERKNFIHYEVASYAKETCQSKHNKSYWHGLPYIGLGLGAAGMFDTIDDFNAFAEACELDSSSFEEIQKTYYLPETATQSPSRIRYTLSSSEKPCTYAHLLPSCYKFNKASIEYLDFSASLLEDCMLSMRCIDGIDSELYKEASSTFPQLTYVMNDLAKRGLVYQNSKESYSPTHKGMMFGNEIYGEIWNLMSH